MTVRWVIFCVVAGVEAAGLVGFAAPAAGGDGVVGLWRTEPDRKNLISNVEVRHCGDSLCGRSTAAFDSNGAPVTTANIGRELFWNMKPDGPDRYSGGTVRLPLVEVEAEGSMMLQGAVLIVRACKLGVCVAQTWTRVK